MKMFAISRDSSSEDSSRSLGSMFIKKEKEFSGYIEQILPTFDNTLIDIRLDELKKAFELFEIEYDLKISLVDRVKNFPKIMFLNPYLLAGALLIIYEKGTNISPNDFDSNKIIMERLSSKFLETKKKKDEKFPLMAMEVFSYVISLSYFNIAKKTEIIDEDDDDEDETKNYF